MMMDNQQSQAYILHTIVHAFSMAMVCSVCGGGILLCPPSRPILSNFEESWFELRSVGWFWEGNILDHSLIDLSTISMNSGIFNININIITSLSMMYCGLLESWLTKNRSNVFLSLSEVFESYFYATEKKA